MKPTILAGIDVGTTKTVTLIAALTPDLGLEILGIGQHPSTGLRKGLVVDLDRTIAAIEESVSSAERMAGEKITHAFYGVTGAHLRIHPATASITVSEPEHGITHRDIARLLEQAKAKELGAGRRLVATLTRDYTVDGQGGIRWPIGMTGLRLEMRGLLVSGDIASLENLRRAAVAAHVSVDEMYLQPIASGEAVLTPEEIEAGTVLIDIGGGTTDVAIYADGAVIYTFVIPVGGDHFDSDLAYAFELDLPSAEWLKIQHGSVRQSAFSSDQVARLPIPRDNPYVAEKLIAEVIHPRANELMDLIRAELMDTNLITQMHGGVVLTGGGSQLDGLTELAHARLKLPARMGRPHGISGRREDLLAPTYATAVGLVKLAARDLEASQAEQPVATDQPGFLTGLLSLLDKGRTRFVDWVKGY